MAFFSQQISSEKWGIYSDTGLIATVSCEKTCEIIMANLASGRRDAPNTDLSSLYKAPKLKSQRSHSPSLTLSGSSSVGSGVDGTSGDGAVAIKKKPRKSRKRRAKDALQGESTKSRRNMNQADVPSKQPLGKVSKAADERSLTKSVSIEAVVTNNAPKEMPPAESA
ncbi:MAG: hypothetical protein AAFQ63_14840 [Cyanobacteria bacterium J06621_11]